MGQFQVKEDRPDDGRVGEKREDLHLAATRGAEQREDLVDACKEHGPPDAGLAHGCFARLAPALGRQRSAPGGVVGVALGRIDVLQLMERDPAAPLDFETAREVAIRGGLKAVIAGEINALGSGFMLTTRIVVAETGEELVSHRETAEDVDALIPAIERLSRRLRERTGESLKTIRRTPPLDQVRTASLEALRLYTEGNRSSDEGGGSRRCLPLLTDAIALDTLFGAAYELRGVCYDNLGMRRERYADYMRAYELRDRMTAYGRAYATGHYFAITGEYEKAVEALDVYHDLYPDDSSPLNILGYRYFRLRDFAHSEEMFLQLSESFLTPPPYVWNGIFRAQVNQGKYEEAEETLRRWDEAMPEDPVLFGNHVSYAGARRDFGTVQAYLDLAATLGSSERASASGGLSAVAAVQGKVDEAEQHFQRVETTELGRLSWLPYLRLLLLGDTVGAIGMVEAVLDRSPLHSLAPDGLPYLDLARFYARAGRTGSARELLAEYDTGIREFIDPGEAEHRRGVEGVVALAEGRTEEAIRDLRIAHERVLDSPIFYLPELGMAYEQAAEPDSALVQYERYLDTPYLNRYKDDPFWLAIVYERLAALYEDRGEVDEAIEYHGKLVDLWKDCDPELRPRVEAAEGAMERFQGGR